MSSHEPRQMEQQMQTTALKAGARVMLAGFTDGCIIPDGEYTVSKVNADGSFHVGGKTAVWPERIKEVLRA